MAPRLPLLAIVAGVLAQEGDIERPTLEEYKDGKEQEKEDAAAVAARDKKLAAVNKVITMLEDLQAQVLGEGEKEAASYNKFACFCKDTEAEKSEAINKGEDDKAALEAEIEDLNTHRDELDEKIEEIEKDIEDAQKAMAKTTKERKAELAVYEKNAADLSAALSALDGAIEVLKSSKNPSLIQTKKVMQTVRDAQVMADALGLSTSSSKRAFASFLQQDPSVPMENYKFHSSGVIETLEGLKGDFRKEKNEIDAAEVKSVAEYDAYMQEKNDFVRAKKKELEDNQKERSKTIEEIAANSEELSTVAADLLDDKQYLMETNKMCRETAKTWDQRSKVRADELSALTAATTIVKESVKEKTSAATVRFAQMGVSVKLAQQMVQDPEAMAAVEAEAEEAEAGKAPIGFLQRLVKRHSPSDNQDMGREAVVNLLRTQGSKLKSTLLTSLATQIRADPLAKVKKLIQELIQRLLHEAAEEANQKGWCDKAQADAKQKRDYAEEDIEDLNDQMAGLEARRNKLNEELDVLEKEIADLKDKREEATAMRKDEKAENADTVLEAEAGLEAVNQAIDILDKFYKTAAKEKVDLSLAQGPADDAPDAGFAAGEAYTGAGGEAGGILGMLDVIKSDFERTISVTQKAEAKAEADYQGFMTESGKSLAEKEVSEEEKTSQRDDAVEKLETASDDLDAKVKILNTAISELLDLKPTCIDTGMSYEERVARREDEIESLKKALCVLTAYAEYGPEGAGTEC